MASFTFHILQDGYSYWENGTMKANGSSTIIKGPVNVIVDTLSPWDKDTLIKALADHDLTCDDIDYVVCTHGHIDHIGNMNLFTKAKWHILGFSISKEDHYYIHPFETNEPYVIEESGDAIKIVPTPGHTMTDVSVIVNTENSGVVAIVGDLFEKVEDIDDPSLFESAGSENVEMQKQYRYKIATMADYIMPGHGTLFQVTDTIRNKLKQYIQT
ncbi:Metallo-beta-lactamase domain-containing protein 1 [Chamberlinius hualienensis]